ncbi:MAG: response regulator [Calditrichaeota bacterium]|nr:response regulator [Calditrichota bacterium]
MNDKPILCPNSRRRVLVVEDEPELVEFISERLRMEGYEVVTAMDGMTGLHLARSIEPDLILLDVMLPKLDGFKIARLLKFDEQYKHIPIILWTWMAEDEDVKSGKYAGVDEYIPKPFSLEALMKCVRKYLG